MRIDRRTWRLILLTSLLFGAHLILSAVRTGPVLVADEIGYLSNARVLAGGLAGQLQLAPFYHGGYSLLLVPVLALAHDPVLAYHLVLAVNAMLAASVFPLLYVLLTRTAGVPRERAVGPALAGAVYPTITLLSGVAMSENALFPLTCLWLIAFCGLLRARRRRSLWAAGTGACAAALWAVHGPMITVVAITGGVMAWLGLRRRLPLMPVAAGLATLAAGVAGTHVLDSFLVGANYGGHAANELTSRLTGALHPHALLVVGENLLGQAWYLVVATFGLALVGLAGAWPGPRRRGPDQTPTLTLLLGALTLSLLLVSAAAFPQRWRPDMLIYGRYLEVTAPPLVALGLARLRRDGAYRGLGRGLWAMVPATAAVVLFRVTAGNLEAANRWNVASLPFVTGRLGPGVLVGAAAVAAAGAWLLGQACTRRPEALSALAVALLLPTLAYAVWNPLLLSQESSYPPGWSSPERVARVFGIRRLAYDADHPGYGLYAIQWFLPETSVKLFHSTRQPPPSRYLLSDRAWGDQHPGSEPRALWSGRGEDLVIWRLSRSH